MEEIKKELTIFEILQKIRFAMTQIELKKSGYNGFAKFNYFELKDFLPTATKLFNEFGLCPVFNIAIDSNGVEYATLTIVKGMENIQFKIPTADPNNSQNPIQNLGSKITYLRRYLYLMALDLVENDVVDAVSGSKEDKKVDLATQFQVDMLSKNKDKLIDKFKELNIKTLNDIKALERTAASELLAELEKRIQGEKA